MRKALVLIIIFAFLGTSFSVKGKREFSVSVFCSPIPCEQREGDPAREIARIKSKIEERIRKH